MLNFINKQKHQSKATGAAENTTFEVKGWCLNYDFDFTTQYIKV